MRFMKTIIFIFTFLLWLLLLIPEALAEGKYDRSGFWGGIDVGTGFTRLSFKETKENEEYFFLGFMIGYTLNPKLQLGLELSGWLIESGNINNENPKPSEGISQTFLIIKYYPSSSLAFFTKIGGGLVTYYIDRPGEPQRDQGWGSTFGIGYDFSVCKSLAITPFLAYSFGKANNQEHNAITIGIGFMIP